MLNVSKELKPLLIIVTTPELRIWVGGGQGGGSPGEQGAGGVREAGGGISRMAGSGREIQKVKLFFVTAYFQSKKRTQQRFLTSI